MKNLKNFPFKNARRITAKETEAGKIAIENKTGKKRSRQGRPSKLKIEKFIPTSIRLHPKILEWAKKQAKKRGCGYQTVINEVLLAAV